MSLLHTILPLDKTLVIELETNIILKSFYQCEDHAAESPPKAAECNLHDKGIGPSEGKDFSTLHVRKQFNYLF